MLKTTLKTNETVDVLIFGKKKIWLWMELLNLAIFSFDLRIDIQEKNYK
jgi:hypothetical protein